MIWAPIDSGLCTMTELKTIMTINDLYDMHEILTVKGEIKRRAEAPAKSK